MPMTAMACEEAIIIFIKADIQITFLHTSHQFYIYMHYVYSKGKDSSPQESD